MDGGGGTSKKVQCSSDHPSMIADQTFRGGAYQPQVLRSSYCIVYIRPEKVRSDDYFLIENIYSVEQGLYAHITRKIQGVITNTKKGYSHMRTPSVKSNLVQNRHVLL